MCQSSVLLEEFVEALEIGMPPTCGFGFGERLFAFLAGKPLREVQLFPLMKPVSHLMTEDGFNLTTEDGNKIIIENKSKPEDCIACEG